MQWGAGYPSPREALADRCASARSRAEELRSEMSICLGVGQKQGKTRAEAEGGEGVGGPNRSKDAGERVAADPAEQRGPVSEESFRREP